MSLINQTYPQTLATGTLNGVPVPGDYMVEALMAEDLVEMTGFLDKRQWRTVMSAIRSGLPVVLTVRDPTDAGDRLRRFTALLKWASVSDGQGHLRAAYWGFEHHVYLADVVSVVTPEVEFL